MLRELENLVADAVQISVPFNNPITGFCAFTHKAGIHAKAILANPSTYEMYVYFDLSMTEAQTNFKSPKLLASSLKISE